MDRAHNALYFTGLACLVPGGPLSQFKIFKDRLGEKNNISFADTIPLSYNRIGGNLPGFLGYHRILGKETENT